MPAIWFRYELSPITVRYIEKNKPFYTFLTTVSILLVFYTLLFFSFDWNKMVVVDKSQTASWTADIKYIRVNVIPIPIFITRLVVVKPIKINNRKPAKNHFNFNSRVNKCS